MNYFDTLFTEYGDRQQLEKKQNRRIFYDMMKERGFDFTDIDDLSKLPKFFNSVLEGDAEAMHKFNAALSDINRKNKETGIELVDAVIFMTTDYLREDIILKFLDEINFHTIRTQFINRYHMQNMHRSAEPSLLDFLDVDDE